MSIRWIILFCQSLSLIKAAEYYSPDHVPLTLLIYNEQNVTIYASASNPQRDPKQWMFWYDPILKIDQIKDIHQFNEYVRFQFSFAASDFDQIARTSIVKLMHPDAERFAMFWTIEPLPIDILNVYIINQKGHPVASVYPCTKTYVSGMNTHECQCQTSSMIAAVWMKDNIVCGKYKLQFEYYLQSSSQPTKFPPSLITPFNLNNLRANYDLKKYIHPKQENELVSRYFVQLQTIDDTIKEARVQKAFRSIINVISRYEVTKLSDLWLGEQVENIINQDLFHISLRGRQHFLFHLKATNSPWALTSTTKQTFNVTEIQTMLYDQLKIQAEWSIKERLWRIKSITAHLLSDVMDFLQLTLINQQHAIDKANATVHRIIDCSEWSTSCVCQSNVPAVVFTSTTQVIRIPNFDADLTSSGFTFELWIRPDILPKEADEVHLLNFRGEYHLTYQLRGEITFSVIEQGQSYLYTTSLQSIPLNKWTHIAGVYSVVENQLQLYINGEFVSSIIHTKKTYPIMKDIFLGQNFRGAMRDFRVWACALSSETIHQSMNMDSLMGNETCLLGYWPMNDGMGPIIPDVVLTSPPRPGTLGLDDNPSFVTDPVWAHVLPKPPPPPEPPAIDYRMFRVNISSPFVVVWGSPYDQPTPGDFDGDGLADFGVYRTIASTWIVASSLNPNIMTTKVWGLTTDRPYPANFDGDKFADYVLFRPATGEWIGHLSSNPAYIFTHRWGRPGDSGCPGDFDGDGKADFAVYRSGVFYINPSIDPSIQWSKQWGQIDDRPVPNCDFDGDGRTDFTVWSPKSAIWSWIPSSAPWLIYQKQWGFTLDRPFCGDYDGDKLKDFVAYRNWTGEWFVLPTCLASFLITFQWGYPTDLPVAGDYDGDGRGDFGLWRPRRNRSHVWEIIPSTMPVVIIRKGWGIADDQPVIGDFDRDKKSDFTVWRPSTGFWYILLIGSPGIQQIKHWGFSFNDTALAADWDGDLFTDYTIYRPMTGFWHIMLARNPLLQIVMQWGVPQFEDVGVPGDFDGDGKFDFAVWRPSTGVWFILPSSNPTQVVISQWGMKGDIPITGVDFDGDGKTDVAVWRPSTGSWFILPSTNPIYPFFGPSLIRQPTVTFPPPPPPPGVNPLPPPMPSITEEPKTTSTISTTESIDYQ